MIRYAEALTRIQEVAKSRHLKVENVLLESCVGRVCAIEILSQECIPPFDNSSMDGFAVRSSAVSQVGPGNPIRLKIVGRLVAGDGPPKNPNQDGAWEIMTGAPFPQGFDAAVKIEDTLVIRNSNGEAIEIEIRDPVMARQNWRGEGEDFKIGDVVLKTGKMLMPEHILALSSLGVVEVAVFKKPKIGILSTGRELVPMEKTPNVGQIRNSTSPYLISALRVAGAEVVHLGTILDEPDEFQKAMTVALRESFDVILTTGAISMGKFDFVTEGLEKLGADISFHKVAIRPGKPLLFGQFKEGPAIFGLPGNPVSGAVGLRFFVDPYLRALNRMKPERPLKAKLSTAVKKPEDLRCFFKSHLAIKKTGAETMVLNGQMSFMVGSLLKSSAWTILSEEKSEIPAGSIVDVYPLYFSSYDWRENHNVGHAHNEKGGCC